MTLFATSLARAIDSAWLEIDPCANFYMERIFDDADYAELIARLPPDALYRDIDHPDARGPDGRATRRLLDLAPHTFARMSAPMADFWRAASAELTSASLTRTVFDKLGIARRDVVPVPIFYKDATGYRIGTHTDAPYKVATLQLYLPQDDALADFGTVFHAPPQEGFRMVKRHPFLPSSGYAFERTDASWHSVATLPRLERPRDSLAITYYLPGYEYSSKPDYIAPERRTRP